MLLKTLNKSYLILYNAMYYMWTFDIGSKQKSNNFLYKYEITNIYNLIDHYQVTKISLQTPQVRSTWKSQGKTVVNKGENCRTQIGDRAC